MNEKSNIWYQLVIKRSDGSLDYHNYWVSPCRKYGVTKLDHCYRIDGIRMGDYHELLSHKNSIEFNNIISLEAAKEIYNKFLK